MLDDKIKTLLTLVDCGSYTKTAQKLHLTQPAVSYQITQLEKQFQIQIFHKNKKGLQLSVEGEILVKYARRMYALSQNCEQSLRDARTTIRHFTIAATPTACEDFVPSMIGEYCKQHTQTHIKLLMDSLDHIKNKLKLFEADIAIVDGRIDSPSYNSILLDTDYLCLIVSPNHRFAKASSVTLQQLHQENFILRSDKAGTRALFERYLANNQDSIRNYNVIIETDNLATIRELVEKDMGVSIMSHNICKLDEAQGRLKMVPIENSSMIREVYIVYHKDFQHQEILAELQEIYHTLPLT